MTILLQNLQNKGVLTSYWLVIRLEFVLGYDSTIPVTIEDMIHHTKAVKQGATDTFIITDMPFLTYHLSVRDTLINAGKLVQEGRCPCCEAGTCR